MRNKWFAIIVNTALLINVPSCARMSTSYLKPSLQELKTIRNIAVSVEGDPKFSHIGATTNESSILLLLFGPPAAIIDTTIRQSVDDKTSNSINPKGISHECREVFLTALVENLRDSRRFDEVIAVNNIDEQYKHNFGAVLEVKIINWGSRIKSSTSNVIIPFIAVHISMVRQHDTRMIWNENQTIVFDTHHTLDDYAQQGELFRRNFVALMNKAGKQISTALLNF